MKWEQLMFPGNPKYECALQPIDFATVAEGFGIKGIRANSDKDLTSCAYATDLERCLHSSLRLMSERNSRRNAPSLRNTPRMTLLVILDALSFTPRQCMQK